MIANRILNAILTATAIIVLPFQIVSTLVLGLAAALTFGLLLIPLSILWALLLFPMLGLSWICNKVPALREIIGIIFIPWAFIANTFVALIPSMGELESRASKLMLCASWPFTWEFWQFLSRKIDLHDYDDPNAIALNEVVDRISAKDPLMQRVLMRVATGQQLDAH